MPVTLNNPDSRGMSMNLFGSDRDISYAYPPGLDLKPGSMLHRRIVAEVKGRAQDSSRLIQSREEGWHKIEHSLTAYVALSDAEKAVKDDDDRKPVSVVVPVTYATLDILLTYWMEAFLRTPLFRYKGVGPEDAVGAALLEAIIQLQAMRDKFGLALYTMWRDAFVYGFGVLAPVWEVRRGLRTVKSNDGFFGVMGNWIGLSPKRKQVEVTQFEGNHLQVVDPYRFLPDPNVPIQEVQRGEYVGWLHQDNYPGLLDQEKNSEGNIFNVRYLKNVLGKSTLWREGRSERDRLAMSSMTSSEQNTRPIDTVYMYINLIPAEWKLGKSEYPEKWFFAVGAESVVNQARPAGLEHGLFPVVVCAPDSDGHSVMPTSKLEVVHGLQRATDWMLSTHLTAVRKSINGMTVVDPFMINMDDLKKRGPGKLIRLRQGVWGRGVKDAIQQLTVDNVTERHVQNIPFLIDIIQRVTGTPDSVQGIMREGGERRSAEEARGTRSGAMARLDKGARIGAMQAHWDLQYMLASHTQQFMTQEVYVKTVGQLEEVLLQEYGHAPGTSNFYGPVRPDELLIDYDIVPTELNSQGADPAVWVQILQSAAAIPEVAQRADIFRLFLHVARVSGAQDLPSFLRRQNPVQMRVVNDETIAQQAQAGNIVPLEEMASANT